MYEKCLISDAFTSTAAGLVGSSGSKKRRYSISRLLHFFSFLYFEQSWHLLPRFRKRGRTREGSYQESVESF
jgi:hypothetical protein